MQEKSKKMVKKLASGVMGLYQKQSGQMRIIDYTLSDVFTLDPNNRWVVKAKLVPWEIAEEKYAHMFMKNGRKAKDIRIALGALLIQQHLKCSDEDVVELIKENPYLQHFIGMDKWSNDAPFEPSLMTWFRKRLSVKVLNEINEEMCRRAAQPEVEKTDDSQDDNDDDEPRGGTLILDATCAPADIAYPTDVNLLADAIEKTDGMIDELHSPNIGIQPRPRTYREKSGRLFKAFIKNRKPSKKDIRRTAGKQLRYLKRNLRFIEEMLNSGGGLCYYDGWILGTIKILYEQQSYMHDERVHSVDDRIVSITQPHIRPIPRGKASAKTEFGAKVSLSIVNGFTFIDHISYDNYNEGILLKEAIEKYKKRFGMLPARILADTIYRNRENRALCKALGIKLSGLPLGRRNAEKYRQQIKDFVADCKARNEVEGKIGTAKTRYGMGRIKAKLPDTGLSVIALSVMVMNLSKLAKAFLRQIFKMPTFTSFKVLAALAAA